MMMRALRGAAARASRGVATLLAAALVLAGCSVAPIVAPSSGPSSAPPSLAPAASEIRPSAEPSAAPDPAEPEQFTTGARNVVCDEVPEGVEDLEPRSIDCRAVYFEEDFPLWTVPLRGPCPMFAVAPDLALFVACRAPDGIDVVALDAGGAPLSGWPISLRGDLADLGWNDVESTCRRSPSLAGAKDGTLYVALTAGGRPFLQAVERDGTPRAGWPVSIPGERDAVCGGFALAPDSTVRLWGYEALLPEEEAGLGYWSFAGRTVFGALDAAGRPLPGWPIGSTATASGPLIGSDGTLYYVSETAKVWAHDARGEIRPGWPYQLPERVRPRLTVDGRLLFVLSDAVVALTATGLPAPGWPVDLPGARATVCLELDLDCYGLVEPAVGSDGRVYVPLVPGAPGRGGRIVALDATGRPVAGWPYTLPDGTVVWELSVNHRGWVSVWTCPTDGCDADPDVLILNDGGEPVY